MVRRRRWETLKSDGYMTRSIITGTGYYLPEKVLSNSDVEKIVDTTHDWIVARTGITQRHIAAEGETTSDMAAEAAKAALAKAGVGADAVDLIIVATTTPDLVFPSTAVRVQAKLGVHQGAAFDVQAVCSGFVYALATANNFIMAGQAKTALVIGADKMSSIVDWKDRGTCVLFGDGAGAVVLQAGEDAERGVLSTELHSDGAFESILYADGGVGSNAQVGLLRMEGREVFKHAVSKMEEGVREALASNDLGVDDIDWLVPHQANARILKQVAKKLGVPDEKVALTVGYHANTSAASIPLALGELDAQGKIQKGQLVVLEALGGGLTWGSAVIRW